MGAAVPRADGAPRRRVGERPLARDRHRAAHDRRPPALDGRHGERGLRPPAGPLREPRKAALPALRRAPIAAQGADEMAWRLRGAGRRPRRGGGGARRAGQEGRLPQGGSPPPAPPACSVRVSTAARPAFSSPVRLDPRRTHRIDVLVDRLAVREGTLERLRASLQKALDLASGVVLVSVEGKGERLLSQKLACPRCASPCRSFSRARSRSTALRARARPATASASAGRSRPSA